MDKRIKEYLDSPSKASSLAYWKSVSVSIPQNMKVVREDLYNEKEYKGYSDVPYFKMVHRLQNVEKPELPNGFRLGDNNLLSLTEHINECYGESITIEELKEYEKRKTYDKDLWITIVNEDSKVVATAIGESDQEVKEGIIEWVEVSKEYRKQGLGTYLVRELLYRMNRKASFVTVAGKLNSESQPIKLYQKCGFIDEVIWHVLTKK